MPVRSSANLPIDSFSLNLWLVNNSTPSTPVTLYPRWRDSTANSFTFQNAGDYAPSAAAGGNAYADIPFSTYPGNGQWYNDVYDNQVGRRSGTASSLTDVYRTSLYANIDVGQSPHPGGDYSNTRLAILYNGIGAYHSWITTGSPTPNYNEPRVLCDSKPGFENFRISGQNYASGGYNSWRCLFHYWSWAPVNCSHLRIINLGGNDDTRSMIVIRGLVLIMHGRTGVSGM